MLIKNNREDKTNQRLCNIIKASAPRMVKNDSNCPQTTLMYQENGTKRKIAVDKIAAFFLNFSPKK